jgi:DNA mismatch repair protein MutH
MKYDSTNSDSIISYAKKLTGKTLRETCGDQIINHNYKGKGNWGQILEKYYFGYEPNSKAEPDFPSAGLEVKSTPLKIVRKTELNAKERLVLNIINYLDIVNEDFEDSSFYKKNKHLLLIFFKHEYNIDILDFVIKIVGDWKFPEADLKIIKNDWNIIYNKIKQGEAHELSEGDTFYLGATTKGGKGGNLRKQPNNNELAKQRCYSFKPKYLNHILASLNTDKSKSFGKLLNSPIELNYKTLEDIVLDKFKPYIGNTTDEIISKLPSIKFNKKSKQLYHSISKAMMGVDIKKEIEEFDKADIQIKAIRIKTNNLPKENISFPAFKYNELINEDWDESEFKEILESKFLFVFFTFDNKNILTLKKVKFWNMPTKDIEIAKRVWDETKKIVSNGDIVKGFKGKVRQTNFPNLKFNKVSHVRPHGRNSKDTYPLPVKDKITQAEEYTKYGFWINNSYIRDEIYLK